MNNLKIFEKEINYIFKDKNVAIRSLTHKSFDKINNNEKLEFLGDRVLALILSHKIFVLYPNEKEGDLDKRFASLVNKKTCVKIAKKINLKKYIILGGTYTKKTVIEDKLLGDLCEALIGAIYIDGGYKFAEKFILRLWEPEIKKTIVTQIDSKTKLQEYSLKKSKKLPKYDVVKLSGPRHKPSYIVSVSIPDLKKEVGKGNSIKSAQQDAAKKILKVIGI